MKHKISIYLSKWQFLLSWIVANVLGIFIGIVMAAVMNDTVWAQPCPPGADCYIGNALQRLLTTGICIGCFVGIAQWLCFQRFSHWWVLISIIGWAAGLACAEIVGNFKASGVIAGSIIGLSEWFILRRIFSNSYWWILALAFSGLAVLGEMWLPPNLIVFDLINRPLTFATIGIFTGVVTGVTFIWILRSPDAS